jgi:hypothetical protein
MQCCTGNGALAVKNAEKQGVSTIFDRHLDEPVFAEIAPIEFRRLIAGRQTAQVVGRVHVTSRARSALAGGIAI